MTIFTPSPAQAALADAIIEALATKGITATRHDEYEKDYISVELSERHPEIDILTLLDKTIEGGVWFSWHGMSRMTIIVGND